jgi:hypothetical protein
MEQKTTKIYKSGLDRRPLTPRYEVRWGAATAIGVVAGFVLSIVVAFGG